MPKTKLLISILGLLFLVISAFGQIIELEIASGKVEKVKSMIEENPELLKTTIGPSKLNLLAFSVAMGNREAAELFIEKGMDVNLISPEGFTLLHIAATFQADTGVTQLLIEKGVDVNAKLESGENEGLTALHILAKMGHKDMAAILLENGADVNAQESKEGNTALHLALGYCQKEIVELLRKYNADANIKNLSGVPPTLYEKLPEDPYVSLFDPKSFETGMRITIKNPTEFPVLIGLYSELKGHKFSIAAQSEKRVGIPWGNYFTYCIYTNNPDVVYLVEQFSLDLRYPHFVTIKLSKNPEKKYRVMEME